MPKTGGLLWNSKTLPGNCQRRFGRYSNRCCRKIRPPKGNQLGPNMHRRFETSVKKRGEETGPNPVDRGKSGTNLRLEPIQITRSIPKGSPMPALSAKNVLNVEKTTPPSLFGLPPWPLRRTPNGGTFRSAS